MISGRVVRGWTAQGSASWARRLPAILSALVFVLAMPGASFGQTIWQGTTGNWNTPGNWTLGVPNSASGTTFDAQIKNGGTAQLLVPGASVRRMRVGVFAGGGHLQVNGGGLTVTEDFILNFAGTGTASTTVQNGGTVRVTGALGVLELNSGATLNINPGGFVNVANLTRTGSGVVNLAGGSLTIDGGVLNEGVSGLLYTGTLTFQNGATMSNIGALVVGNAATGTLNVSSGATPSTSILAGWTGSVFIGHSVGGDGTANIGGAGSMLRVTDASVIRVGFDGGTGILNVNSGGSVAGGLGVTGGTNANSFGTINLNAGGTITSARGSIGIGGARGVATIEGTWNTTGKFDVGGFDGANFGTSGTVQVNSGGLLNVGTDLIVYGPGRVNVNAGGHVSVNALAVSGGTFNLAGGMLSLPAFTPPTSGSFNFSSGAVAFTNDWTGAAGQISGLLGTGASLSNGKTIQVAGATTLQSGLNLNGGTLRTGSITGLGSLALNTGTLELTNSSLSIGSAGPLGALATVGTGLNLRVSGAGQSLSVAADGVLNLTGGTAAGTSINNVGEIALGGSVAALGLAGQSLTNAGRLSGTGRVNANLANIANGRIISDGGQRLVFAGAVNSNNANGRIEISGGAVEFTGTLANNSGGTISGRGVFRGSSASTSGMGLVNAGKMQFSGGPTDIFGNVTFTGGAGGGEMINSGGGNVVTFYDNVTHIGDEIRTSPTNTTVFFGNVTGNGPFTGTGSVRFEGMLAPGLSPAEVSMEGSAELSGDARLVMELGGTVPGDQHDQLEVEGLLSLGGKLEVALLDGFMPRYGDTFDLLDFGALSGRFDTLNLPVLDAGLVWDTSALYSSGAITAVPEPAGILLLFGGFGCLLWRLGHLTMTCARNAL